MVEGCSAQNVSHVKRISIRRSIKSITRNTCTLPLSVLLFIILYGISTARNLVTTKKIARGNHSVQYRAIRVTKDCSSQRNYFSGEWPDRLLIVLSSLLRMERDW
ncbi:hypothetical protein ACJMK2_024025 [Sinanodonta woodiana]|uniref:Uncharacterized protein n=1 Tax=Sinanodonta woodiana TaxID=1069815 RepID=A0ABD3T726_SINWO